MNQALTYIKGESDVNTLIVGDCNTSLPLMSRSYRQKISEATDTVNDTIKQT